MIISHIYTKKRYLDFFVSLEISFYYGGGNLTMAENGGLLFIFLNGNEQFHKKMKAQTKA